MKKLLIKRVYSTPQKTDGYRILVDRLWPRGIKKSEAKVDLWLKEIAPSNELRKWFDHDPKKWSKFKIKYTRELLNRSEELKIIQQKIKDSTVTLVYGAKDKEHNQAVALQEIIENNKNI